MVSASPRRTPAHARRLTRETVLPCSLWGKADARFTGLFPGGLIIGVFFEVLFLGMIITQVAFYVPRASRDPVLLKILVAVLFFSVMIKSGIDIKTVYSNYVFGVYKTQDPTLPWSIKVGLVVGQITLLASQLYLCFRLWAASERRKLPTAIGLIGSCASCAIFIVYAVRRISRPQIIGNENILQYWLPLWAFSACAIDLYLSIAFAHYLLRARRRAISYKLEFMLGRLTSIAITTCFPSAVFALLLAILEIVAPDRSPWLFFLINVSSVYTLCILHTLNSRKQITEDAVRIVKADPTGGGLAKMQGEGQDATTQPASLISILSRATRQPGGVSKTTFDEETGLSSKPGHSMQHLHRQGSTAQGVGYEIKVERKIERMNSIDFSTMKKAEEDGDVQLMGTPATDTGSAEAEPSQAANQWTCSWAGGPPMT
ncbi:BZ3500_MvSof-1268-A1-R1_Chr10-1g02553 [Microbotryum saponariae]|uniref:BZ3500_MvSof-1268-A1-R1_Chr10-1g02553 protein n=1 Tax=Microbotryum saponariae TaxID=289078 RepID=A0A2X0NEN1_9BASI|nr:BZ3500_MvSof-1268-A1-R1_Chr10-1g02553 [Microbotryum saponariae]SDA06042.1 BZ3501_MvSof-1269-A2-R1_Chr10-1g02154 [Microbotryum saponariae]